MSGKDINQVLADNLRSAIEERELTQAKLAEMTGMGQTTVSLYLRPGDRKAGKSGKPASGKLSELEAFARALECEPWELLTTVPVKAKGDPDWRTVALSVAKRHPHADKRAELGDFIRRVDSEFEEIKDPTRLT